VSFTGRLYHDAQGAAISSLLAECLADKSTQYEIEVRADMVVTGEDEMRRVLGLRQDEAGHICSAEHFPKRDRPWLPHHNPTCDEGFGSDLAQA
jgi:hypothetical protein